MSRSAPTDRIFFFILLGLFLFPLQLQAQDGQDAVRVRLLRDISPRTIVVSSNEPANLYAGDSDNPIAQLRRGEKLPLTTSNNQVYFRLPDGQSIYARSLTIAQDAQAELTVEVLEAKGMISPRSFRGAFMVQVDPAVPSTLSIINEVMVEDYVEGVLASEFNFNELEASKAMAVCIRTMAYRAQTNLNGPHYTIPDNELWQVYHGTGAITRTIQQAVADTRGEVLKFNGELAEAVYFASSGGHTANNEDVWNASNIQPYLRGKDDPYDYNSPNHTWESSIPRNRLLRTLGTKYRIEANGIRILDRSRDGRVRTMGITDADDRVESVSSNEFRLLVNEHFGRETIKSTMFQVNVQPDVYIFSGKGYGHGVGLNQWGALQLSKKGNLYDEILSYYYTGAEIQGDGFASNAFAAASNYFDDAPSRTFNDDSYSPNIEPASVSDEFQSFNTTPERSDDIASRLMGDDGDEPIVEEEKEGRRRLFRLRRNRSNTDRATTKKAPKPRPTGKRIGW